MTDCQKVDAYIARKEPWSTQLKILRSLCNETMLVEAVKWGAPAYMIDTTIIIGLASFKNHMGIWFHHGVFLNDPHEVLYNAQDGKTKGLRQWRFYKDDVIPQGKVAGYIDEAIKNYKAGKVLKPGPSKKIETPAILKEAFITNENLLEAFETLTAYKQKEYKIYIEEAKRASTKQNRIKKIIPMIREGVGLNDKYK